MHFYGNLREICKTFLPGNWADNAFALKTKQNKQIFKTRVHAWKIMLP